MIRNQLRANYQLLAVNAGDVDKVHQETVKHLFRQQNIRVSRQVDILILGVPNYSPYSAMSIFNPILLRSITLGYYYGMFRKKSLVKNIVSFDLHNDVTCADVIFQQIYQVRSYWTISFQRPFFYVIAILLKFTPPVETHYG